MKKFRVNVKRLSMTLGVLGTSVGLLTAAAWYTAPLAASVPPGDPALIAAEPSADELAALGEAAPPPTDPLQDLGGADVDELRDQKAGKHGPTAMAMAAGADVGEPVAKDPITEAPIAQAAAPTADAPSDPAQAPAATGALPDAPLEAGAAGSAAMADLAEPAGRAPLITVAAMDPAPVAQAPARRAAVGWRPVGRIWRGENPSRIAGAPRPAAAAPAAVAQVGEARWDVASRTLAVPVDGQLGRRGLTIHRLGDGRAYVDLPHTRPAFSGSRAQDVVGGPISRWVMAAHDGHAGVPTTRVAFRLEGGAVPRLEVGGGEVRIALAPAVGGARAVAQAPAAKAGVPAQAGGTRLGEARYDVAAGVLSMPIEGAVDPASLRLKRLGDGRLYLDVAGARPAFSGTRQAAYPGHALTRWAMAGHLTAGQPLTRLAFTLARPGDVDVRVADGEIRLTLPGHTGIRSAPAAPAAPGGMSEEEAVDADIQ